MSKTIEQLMEQPIFYWFAEISKIPRCSGEEKRISDFLVAFAKERGFEVVQDEALNVVIRKPGTKGYENSATVILQGHMDMVCEKTNDSTHDFSCDPIKLVVNGDTLRADNTTLGGDDGIAVAYILAILDAKDIAHPPLEALITTSEETSMVGALSLKKGVLKGNILVNIDSEEEGIFLTSCAGGANSIATFTPEKKPFANTAVELTVTGTTGGHSGMEIIKQRANAVKIMARVLHKIQSEQSINLVHISGGSKHNAIPKNAQAVISIADANKAQQTIQTISAALKAEYRKTDPHLVIDVTPVAQAPQEMFTVDSSQNIIDFLMMIPDGVCYMSPEIEGLVQTSVNDAIVAEVDGTIVCTASVRSSVSSALHEVLDVLHTCAQRCGAHVAQKESYPPWEYAPQSEVRGVIAKTYKEITGKDPQFDAVHAGLECGLLKSAIDNMDAISFGPNLYDVHTPDEHMSISSAERVYDFTLKFLANMK